MISKAIRGQGFSGCISYICEKSNSVRMQNLVAGDWRKAAAEMRTIADSNRTSKPVYHSILSFDPSERVTDEQMFQAATLMLEKLGLGDNQSVMAVHRDRNHLHVHCVSNLIGFSGRATRLDHDFRSRPVFAREIEKEMGLKAFERQKEQTMNRIDAARIAEVRSILPECRSFEDFQSRLKKAGLRIDEKSSRSNAITYRVTDISTGAYVAASRISPSISSPSAVRKYFSKVSPKSSPKESLGSSSANHQKVEQVKRAASEARSMIDFEHNLSKIGAALEIVKVGERVRGANITFEDGAKLKLSEAGLSLKGLSEQFAKTEKPVIESSKQDISPAIISAAVLARLRVRLDMSEGQPIYRDIKTDTEICRDEGHRLAVTDPSDAALLTSLRLAQAKFPNGFQVSGSPQFRADAIRLAAENRIQINGLSPEDRAVYDAHKPPPRPLRQVQPDLRDLRDLREGRRSGRLPTHYGQQRHTPTTPPLATPIRSSRGRDR